VDRVKLLQTRRQNLLRAGEAVRADISLLVDKDSFVETSAFSYSEGEFYDGAAEGEGVVCGFATIEGYPYYIVAQNSAVLCGGVGKAGCEKISSCLAMAEKTSTPVIYMLSTLGVRVGEGIEALEGLAQLMLQASRLSDSVAQYLIVNGEVYGQIAMLAGICDFNFFIDKKSVLAMTSPLVITASVGENLAKEKVGGADALNKTALVTFKVSKIEEVRRKIAAINDIVNDKIIDCDNLNAPVSELNSAVSADGILKIFDEGSAMELFAGQGQEVKCYFARIGGISVATTVFCGGEAGVKLCPGKMRKINKFASLANALGLPYVSFVNTLGVVEKPEVANSMLISQFCDYVKILDGMDCAKISVIYGKAVGLGYTLFAAKSLGYDFVYAFTNSQVALFDSALGAEIELAGGKKQDKAEIEKHYAEISSDPFNAAKGGYIDNIIEPAFARQYLISSLQMLLK